MTNLNIERYFKSFPTMSHPRNRFPWEKSINYNMKMGEITPITAIRVVPGCTYNLDMSTVIKVAPLQNPPQDDAIFKAFAFVGYDRNVWDNYKYWFGEKKYPENPEMEPTYLVPKVKMPDGGFEYNGFYDNIGCNPEVGGYEIDAFLPRHDRDIYNNYFRNQTLENPLEINRGDSNDEYEQNAKLRLICRPRDYFAQGLPTVSGTTPVEIPLGSEAPVIGNGNTIGLQAGDSLYSITGRSEYDALCPTKRDYVGVPNGTQAEISNTLRGQALGLSTDPTKSGLIADLSQTMGAPIEGLYQAIAYNTYNYLTSRTGNRYFELVSNLYGTVNPDAVMRIPEFLGSLSQMIEFDTVTQTSSTSGQDTPLAHRAANGYMENYGSIINKSFGEFGWILIYGVVTHYPKYQQGVSRLMQTNDPLELFNPIFNLIGDEPIYNSEIYIQSDDVVDEEGTPINNKVFAYGKRNSKFLYPIDEIHGEQRSQYAQSLDTNHFGEYFEELPILNKEFDKINDTSFKRCLQVTDETQFICNTLITGTLDVEIPTEAIPMAIPQISFKAR